MACSCKGSSWLGQSGFKVVNDDTFMLPEPNEWAGWKPGYGPACDCGSNQNGKGCGCGGGCGSRRQPTLDSRVDSLIRMADSVDSSLAFGPRYYTGVGSAFDGLGGTGNQGSTTTSTTAVGSSDIPGISTSSSTPTSTTTSLSTTTNTTTADLCCCDPTAIEVVDDNGKPQTGETLETFLTLGGGVLANANVFNVKFKYKKRGSGPSKPCKVKWWEWTDTARKPYKNIVHLGRDEFGDVFGGELVPMPTKTWFDMAKVQTATNDTLEHGYGATPCPGEGSFIAKDHPSNVGMLLGGHLGIHITFTGSGEPDCKKQIELRCVQTAGAVGPTHMSCFGKDNKGTPLKEPKDPEKAPDWNPLTDRTPYDEKKDRAWNDQMSLGKLRGGLCFIGETPVVAARGLVMICDICIGDEVATVSRATGEAVMRRVIRKDTHEMVRCDMRRITTDSGSSVVVHGSHLVALENGEWTTADCLISGSRLLGLYGRPVVVGASAEVSAQLVYNIAVADSGHYFVGPQAFMVSDGSGLSRSSFTNAQG